MRLVFTLATVEATDIMLKERPSTELKCSDCGETVTCLAAHENCRTGTFQGIEAFGEYTPVSGPLPVEV